MAKIVKQKKIRKDEIFPLEKRNFVIMGFGLLLIIVGYIALMQDGVEGFLPLYVAPILLFLGYCVVIPLGIMYTKKEKPSAPDAPQQAS